MQLPSFQAAPDTSDSGCLAQASFQAAAAAWHKRPRLNTAGSVENSIVQGQDEPVEDVAPVCPLRKTWQQEDADFRTLVSEARTGLDRMAKRGELASLFAGSLGESAATLHPAEHPPTRPSATSDESLDMAAEVEEGGAAEIEENEEAGPDGPDESEESSDHLGDIPLCGLCPGCGDPRCSHLTAPCVELILTWDAIKLKRTLKTMGSTPLVCTGNKDALRSRILSFGHGITVDTLRQQPLASGMQIPR